MDTERSPVGDHRQNDGERAQWKIQGFRPSFVELPEERLASLDTSQRRSMAKEFVHDGASFFQRGYIHYALQLWRQGVRIDPDVDVAACGYDTDAVVAMFEVFKAEDRRSQPAQAASEILYGWISSLPSAQLYMVQSQYSSNARCPYCDAPCVVMAWPTGGDAVPFYYCTLEECHHRPGGYLVDGRCGECRRVWCVVWDESPIWA